MSIEGVSPVVYPTTKDEIRKAFELAREKGWKVHFSGARRSYGDAGLNDSNLVVDLTRMNRILSFDPETGVARLEPGVTLQQLSEFSLPRGYWPPVVSGTRHTTIGGCVAANVHGKNNYTVGPWGDHVLSLELVTPAGEVLEVSRDERPELFRHVIGGFGALCAIGSFTVQLKKVYSGRLQVQAFSAENLEEMFRGFERHTQMGSDYVVGWIDAFGAGPALGRGQIHAANYVEPGEDPAGAQMMSDRHQQLPTRLFGIVPKGWLWFLARPMAFRWGMRLINAARYWWSSLDRNQHRFLQSHTGFNHLLDYVPNWKWFYLPGGLIQYQLLVPAESARTVFASALQMAQDVQLEPWLVVMKRHRPDDYPLSHAVDGYSLAMDFRVTDRDREALWKLCDRYNALIVEAGGRFYFAKDQVVAPQWVLKAWGKQVFSRFFALKDQVDPEGLIEGSLWRRVFAPLRAEVPLLEEKPVEPSLEAKEPLPVGDPGDTLVVPESEQAVSEE